MKITKSLTILNGLLLSVLVTMNVSEMSKASTRNIVTTMPIAPRVIYVPMPEKEEPAEEIQAIAFIEPEPVVEVVKNIQPVDINFDILTPSNFTTDDLLKALNTEPHSNLSHLAQAFVDAEAIYGVNSLYLLATVGWESGWGRYKSATNNIAGLKRNDYKGYKTFDSEYDCVMEVAKTVASYERHVGSNIVAVTSRYCPNEGYTKNILGLMQERLNKIL